MFTRTKKALVNRPTTVSETMISLYNLLYYVYLLTSYTNPDP